MSGFAAKNGFPDKPPALPNLGLADMVAGLSGFSATLIALREAEKETGGARLSTSPCSSRCCRSLGRTPRLTSS